MRVLIQSIDRLADNCHMPEFTNHALPHICSIVKRASDWAEGDGWIERISRAEAGYLLLHVRKHPALDKAYENIVEKVKMALDYLENSTQWFGEQGYRELAEKNRWYKQWLERVEEFEK